MSKNIDNGEFYSSKQENIFKEFKEFKAEEYYIIENKKEPLEINSSNEFFDTFNNEKTSIKNNRLDDEIQNNKKLIEKQNNINKNIVNSIKTSAKVLYSCAVAVVATTTIDSIPDFFDYRVSNSESIELPSISNTESVEPIIKEILISNIKDNSTFNQIIISGKIDNVVSKYNYVATINQINEDNEIISFDEYIPVEFENNLFKIKVEAAYGIKKYEYSIGYYENDEFVQLTSGNYNYNISQYYNATYDKVTPEYANITYNDDGSYNVHVDTNFITDYPEVFRYGLSILNKEGIVIGSYEGVDSSIDISIEDASSIYFSYFDLGIFKNNTHLYQEYSDFEPTFVIEPNVELSESAIFNGQYFEINYFCNSVYDYSLSSIDLYIIDENNNRYEKHIEDVLAEDKIILDMIDGEPGNITIEGIYNFEDNQKINASKQVKIVKQEYQMNYLFNVNKVIADISESKDTIPITFEFEYEMPQDYKISITDTTNSINKVIDLNDSYTFDEISSSTATDLKVSILDKNNMLWKEIETFTISKNDVNNLYEKPYIDNPKPGSDSLVTFNDDGTMNIYRNMQLNATDKNIYYDAWIYTNYDYDTNTYSNQIHDYRNSKYSIIENIPIDNYVFQYYMYYEYQNVSYCVTKEVPPSGALYVKDMDIKAIGTYDDSVGLTNVELTLNSSSYLKGEYVFDGKEYEFTPDSQLTIIGNAVNKNITFYYNEYLVENYDEYINSSDVTIIGSLYKEYTIKIEEKGAEPTI